MTQGRVAHDIRLLRSRNDRYFIGLRSAATIYSHSDKALLAEFQRTDWRRRQEIVSSLSDARLRQLGRRLVAFHAPELLSPIERTQYEAWLRARWSMPDAPQTEWMTASKAQRALDDMRADQGLDQILVGEIAAYLDDLERLAD